MNRFSTIRTPPAMPQSRVRASSAAVLALAMAGGSAWAAAHPGGLQQNNRPVPIIRQAPQPTERPTPKAGQENQFAPRSGQNQEHLQQWMQSHSNLTLDQQQHALDNEPGFRQLNPEAQQRMHDRLAQLNAMSPEQRQRAFARTEAMERLAPEQRQQVRNALTSLGALPKDRRMYVARQFRAMRDMDPGQRQAFMNSAAMRAQFSDQERQTLSGLFAVAPYLPAPPQPGPGQPMPQPMPPR